MGKKNHNLSKEDLLGIQRYRERMAQDAVKYIYASCAIVMHERGFSDEEIFDLLDAIQLKWMTCKDGQELIDNCRDQLGLVFEREGKQI